MLEMDWQIVSDIEGRAARFVSAYYVYIISTSVCSGTLAKAKVELEYLSLFWLCFHLKILSVTAEQLCRLISFAAAIVWNL